MSTAASRFVRTENNVYYLEGLSVPTPTVNPEVAHHILVVDRSGSMWGDIDRLKESIEQALAIESYTNGDVETTLISFSTHGDVTLHWKNVSANDVLKLDGPHIKQLRAIRATFLTGISQGLDLALEQVNLKQTTGITLFTDGYANSPSSYRENQSLDAFVRKAQEHPGLFFNAIGYRDWCDWPRMNSMTNALSGKTVRARTFKDVLDAMKDTQSLLTGNVRPAISIPARDGIMLMAVNRTTGQVNATNGDLSLRGSGAEDNIDIYAVAKVAKTYNIPTGVLVIPTEESYLFGALTTAYTSMQDLRTAKDLLFASGNKTLWAEHQSAMTPSTLSAMLSDLSGWVQSANNDNYEMGRNTRPQYNLFDFANAVNSLPPRSIGIDTDVFYKAYRRRSLKRIPGKRLDDGTVTPPRARLQVRDADRVYVRGMKFNTTDASVQLETACAVDLVKLAHDSDGNEISATRVEEVEYIPLDKLQDFRSYTMISSGERNVEEIPLRVFTEQAWNALKVFLVPSKAKTFTPGQSIRIELKRFALEATTTPSSDEIFAALATQHRAQASVKALSAMQDKGAASPYTPEQVAALKEVHLSPALFFSAPSMTHYDDKDAAVAKGEIDSYTRYRVYFGTTEILNSGAFKSGNAFCARRYAVTDSEGNDVKKPKLDTYLQGASYAVRAGKGKDTPADVLMTTVFDGIILGPKLDNDAITSELKHQKRIVEDINDSLQGLVMEIGCTGLLPSNIEDSMTRYEPDDFAAKFGVKLKKAEKEGIFYAADNGLVVSIIPDTSWYTVKAA
jgi:hypothetical protein